MFMHIKIVKALVNQIRFIEVNITNEDVYMLLLMSLPPSFDNLATSLESMSTKDVDLQFIVARLHHEVSKRKECESFETTTLVNKTHKSNEKLCFYCKKPRHFVRNCLKKKNDEKEKVNQAWEDHEQMFVVTLSANNHTTYDWIVDFGAMQHMTFHQEWFTTYECISPRRVFMGDDTILEAVGKGNIKATMQVGGKLLHTTITQVLHVPKMKNNLISVNKFISEGFKVEFDKDGRWETFCDVHEAKTIGKKLFLQRRFFTIKMQEGDDMLVHINKVKALADQLRSIEVNITDEDVYMLLLVSLPPSFDNLVTSLESMSTKDVNLQFIVTRLLHEVSKRKEYESFETTALVNKTHKVNEKLCFYCKKPSHFVRNCLKKKSDGKKKTNQTCEDHEKMLIAALNANDHTTYDWIVNSGATQHMTFEQEWFTTYERISPRKVFMGDDTVLEAIGKGNIKATMQVGGELSHATITQVLHIPKNEE